ncbi:hypothetical protein [Ruegeria sp. HKCCD4332]|uniref:hypothetical protein n=1 Tax=Ruegeria sp. HKCCD4332 TaxID=2683021 RepID=UPI001491A1F3|nr:hypothetical protein [Ruegeria sp. HKCCD4332]NOD77318.1 hypothetical protein [Ruegeria sp. HKCCD4332]
MVRKNLVKSLVVLVLLAGTTPSEVCAKPNSYPGEHSKFKNNDPEAIAEQKAEQKRRKELRQQRREERKRKRLEKRTNRLK